MGATRDSPTLTPRGRTMVLCAVLYMYCSCATEHSAQRGSRGSFMMKVHMLFCAVRPLRAGNRASLALVRCRSLGPGRETCRVYTPEYGRSVV